MELQWPCYRRALHYILHFREKHDVVAYLDECRFKQWCRRVFIRLIEVCSFASLTCDGVR